MITPSRILHSVSAICGREQRILFLSPIIIMGFFQNHDVSLWARPLLNAPSTPLSLGSRPKCKAPSICLEPVRPEGLPLYPRRDLHYWLILSIVRPSLGEPGRSFSRDISVLSVRYFMGLFYYPPYLWALIYWARDQFLREHYSLLINEKLNEMTEFATLKK